MEEIIEEIITYIVTAIQQTPVGSKTVDITKIKATLTTIITNVYAHLDNQDKERIMTFIKNQPLLQNCIIPNIAKITSDGKLAIDDVPAFLDIIIGTYASVNDFIQENKTITISSNDIIELVGLIVKIILVIVVQDQVMANMGVSLTESAVKLVKLTIKPKTCTFKCCCK